jgi:hypothetical protein
MDSSRDMLRFLQEMESLSGRPWPTVRVLLTGDGKSGCGVANTPGLRKLVLRLDDQRDRAWDKLIQTAT